MPPQGDEKSRARLAPGSQNSSDFLVIDKTKAFDPQMTQINAD
jgi:hypothetical protein